MRLVLVTLNIKTPLEVIIIDNKKDLEIILRLSRTISNNRVVITIFD